MRGNIKGFMLNILVNASFTVAVLIFNECLLKYIIKIFRVNLAKF